jgi:hypothetical protein
VKQLTGAGDHDKISAVITLLTTEFTYSPQTNHPKGGLIGLAAATVGLTSEASQHLEIVKKSLNGVFLLISEGVPSHTTKESSDFSSISEISHANCSKQTVWCTSPNSVKLVEQELWQREEKV